MQFTPDVVVFIFAIQFIGYLVKGLVGFGNPLISSPLLSMRLDNVLITPGTLLLDLPVNGYLSWKNRQNLHWRRILPLLVAEICGIIPGTLLLRFSMPWVIKTVLGVVVLLLGVEMATRSLRPKRDHPHRPALDLAVSFISGICAGLFGIGMILVGYLQRTARDYNDFKGTICVLFLGDNLCRVISYCINGFFTREVLLFGACSVPAALLAMLAANRLSPRLDEQKLLKGAFALFILGGTSIIVKSVLFHT